MGGRVVGGLERHAFGPDDAVAITQGTINAAEIDIGIGDDVLGGEGRHVARAHAACADGGDVDAIIGPKRAALRMGASRHGHEGAEGGAAAQQATA